jgi:rhodanese-related sulfurtransferase
MPEQAGWGCLLARHKSRAAPPATKQPMKIFWHDLDGRWDRFTLGELFQCVGLAHTAQSELTAARRLQMNTTQQRMSIRLRRSAMVAIVALLVGWVARAETLSEIDVAAAAARIQAQQIKVLDVREPSEFATGVIQGAVLMPLGQVERRVAELAAFKDQPMLVVCGSGGRSAHAIKLLSKYGFTQMQNIKGGMDAWRKAKLPVVKP